MALTLRSQASAMRAAFSAPRVSSCRAAPVVAQRPSKQSTVVCQASAAAAEAPAARKYHPSPLSQAAPATYAIIEVGGHQMFVEPGKWYTCNRLQAEVGSKIKFGRVLAAKSAGKLTVGKPYMEGVTVEAEVLEELRGEKLIVFKHRPKKHYRRKAGHRQELTKFLVTKVEA